MDNRINEIRRKISSLRTEMALLETAIRDQVNHDLDCTEAACRLMAMRAELVALIGRWKAAGGNAWMPGLRELPRKTDRSAEQPIRAGRR